MNKAIKKPFERMQEGAVVILCMVCALFAGVLNAQTASDKKVVWDYPVKPGMEEWNWLKTEKERVAAVQVPEDILAKLSSDELVELCISFPLFGYFTAFNTPQDGFNIMFSRFNIFNHLLQRKDVGKNLLAVFKYMTKIYKFLLLL